MEDGEEEDVDDVDDDGDIEERSADNTNSYVYHCLFSASD